ncbi:MAG TPA: NAD(P)/FAD-dependent oxidoreductase, partial [Clostridia bacterium]|nr:NAD(P)/FAD-dependent oxidoreductase [Clostridia bacterium]
MKKWDYIIVGAGPSGIFAALELKKMDETCEILMIEKGNPIGKRTCPKRITGKCV